MDKLVYPKEQSLGRITLVLGILAWLSLIIGTFGLALLFLVLGFVLYLFAQSALIAHIKGNGVELSQEQFPDLYSQFMNCCEKLQIETPPQAYILNDNGGLNAFATKFLGTQYVVLLSDVVDAMDEHEDGVSFYIGHELGHLKRKHLSGGLLRWPIFWLPLLGAAYSRARETTCDRHGLACCNTPEGAVRSLAALSAGSERWAKLDITSYVKQSNYSSGFWMSFHELTSGYPWLTKRSARVADVDAVMPKRNFFSYIPAAFIPFAGRLGAGFGALIMVYIIIVIVAIGYPAYKERITKTDLTLVIIDSQSTRDALGEYYLTTQTIPESLADLDILAELTDGSLMVLNSGMILSINTSHGQLVFTPAQDDNGEIIWSCENGNGLKAKSLPASCSSIEIE